MASNKFAEGLAAERAAAASAFAELEHRIAMLESKLVEQQCGCAKEKYWDARLDVIDRQLKELASPRLFDELAELISKHYEQIHEQIKHFISEKLDELQAVLEKRTRLLDPPPHTERPH
jgi:hypothetical protein